MGKVLGARVLLVRANPSVPVYRARRVVHARAPEEVLKKGKRSLERRADGLEGVLGTRPETRVVSEDEGDELAQALVGHLLASLS